MKYFITENQFKQIIESNIDKNITAYHGTNHEIKQFVTDFISGADAKDANGPGIYFSNNRFDSEHYGEWIYTVNLNVKNFISDKNKRGITPQKALQLIKMVEDWRMNAQDWHENPDIGVNIFMKQLFDNNDNSVEILLEIFGDYYRYTPKLFVSNCVKLGIDGINVTNLWGGGGSSEHYIVYNPEIIKIINVERNDNTQNQ